MRGSKIVSTALVILIIFAFTFTTVGAQAPVTAEDSVAGEPGGEVLVEQLPILNGGTSSEWLPAGGGITPQILPPPYPEYPVWDYVYSKTPIFVFSRHPTATKYCVEVYDHLTGTKVYSYKAIGDVHGDSVWIKPPFPLKYFNITGKVGWYWWRVSAKVGTDWIHPSPQVEFRVATAGFESTFNTNARGWLTLNGAWSVISPGYLKNPGSYQYRDSIVYKKIIAEDFDLTVRMKIKDIDTGHFAGVIVAGEPGTIGTEGEWTWGYYVLYRDDGYAAVYARDGVGNWETLFPWTLNPIIDPGGWNKIELITGENRTKFYVLFNDSLWTTITIPGGMRNGYVGITNYRNSVEKESVLIDWVKMTVNYDV